MHTVGGNHHAAAAHFGTNEFLGKIFPLRKRGNFLLCSILLGNVMVNAVSTLILGDMVSGT